MTNTYSSHYTVGAKNNRTGFVMTPLTYTDETAALDAAADLDLIVGADVVVYVRTWLGNLVWSNSHTGSAAARNAAAGR